jgi:Txe/YoeB family toxin of toxin-antitoxin system
MVKYTVVYTEQAVKDISKLKIARLFAKTKNLVNIISQNPFQTPPTYEKLKGDLYGAYLRRINMQHRLIYEVIEKEHIVKIISLWSRYE